MLIRTHIVFAVLIYFLLLNLGFLAGFDKLIFFAFFILGSFFPDIDSPKSKAGRFILLRPLQWIFGHRGMFHSLVFALVISSVIYFFNETFGIAFFAGYVLHLFLDALTKLGIPFFWPLSGKKFSLLEISSGGLIEEIIFVLVLLADAFLVIMIFA